MTDNNNHNQTRLLTEKEMDQLLTCFYQAEVPQALENLPSSWPALVRSDSETPQTSAIAVTRATLNPVTQPTSTASRGIAVAVTTLAACLMLILFSNFATFSENSGTAERNTQPQTLMPTEESFYVSEGDSHGALDENQTSLEEIDQIDLTPREQETPQTFSKE